ncbi:MAG: hypothetical protein OXF27_08370, partial [Acidobacteria bacterium]|nr:hypothetical protein [Acidobacteriota bacterium]
RYDQYEQASAAAREIRQAHARDAAETAEARQRIEKLDLKIAALEAQQRQAEEAARRRKETAGRRKAEKRRDDARWGAKAKDRETALGLLPGGVELYLAHLADIDPKWNVSGNIVTAHRNVDAALDAAESDARRLDRLRAVLTDENAAARYRRRRGESGERFTTADIDEALAPAEALRSRVSRLRELFAAPGGDAAFFAALEDRSPSWQRTATPIDIERALDVAGRNRRRRHAATWQHRLVLEAEQQFPGASSAAWQRTGERFDQFTDTGRSSRRLTRTLSDRARALAVAAERPEPPASSGLVKRLLEWVRERVQKMLRRLRPSKAADRQDHSLDHSVEPTRAAAAERAQQEQRHARELITAARAAARRWGDIPLATETLVSVAESLGARPGTSAAHRAVLERIREAAPHSSLTIESATLRLRCLGEKDAAADRRYQQALGVWKAQSWTRRRMTGRPQRESPDPPSHQELAAAREELAGVVRSAMTAELDRLMPQRRPDSPPADGAAAPRAKAATRRDQLQVERPVDEQRQVPRRTPDTRPDPAPPRSRPPRDRGHEPSR